MPVGLYFDVHAKAAICEQLRRREVDVLTAQEDDSARRTDEELLERAAELGRVVFTHDNGFRVLAEDWQRQGRRFAALIFGREQGGSIGDFVRDLELIAKASDVDYWVSRIERIPYKSVDS